MSSKVHRTFRQFVHLGFITLLLLSLSDPRQGQEECQAPAVHKVACPSSSLLLFLGQLAHDRPLFFQDELFHK